MQGDHVSACAHACGGGSLDTFATLVALGSPSEVYIAATEGEETHVAWNGSVYHCSKD